MCLVTRTVCYRVGPTPPYCACSGLIRDYYAARASLVLSQALEDATHGNPLNQTAVAWLEAQLAYNWTNARNAYPTLPVGDPVEVSLVMYAKYGPYFSACKEMV